MTLRTYAHDAGPEGGAVTEANSGASLLNTANGGSSIYTSGEAVLGSAFGVRASNVAGTARASRYPLAASNVILSYSGFHHLSSVSGLYDVCAFRHSSGYSSRFLRAADGTLAFWPLGAGGTGAVEVLSPSQAAANPYPRLVALLDALAGTWRVKALTQGGALLAEKSGSGGLGTTNPFTHVECGPNGAVSHTIGYDMIQVDDGSTTEIVPGVTPTNQTPTATITSGTPSSISQNSTVPLRGTATDPDGTIASVAWSITAWPAAMSGPPVITNPGSLTAASFLAGYPGDYTVRLAVTDDKGANATATKVITVTANSAAKLPPAELTWTGTAWK